MPRKDVKKPRPAEDRLFQFPVTPGFDAFPAELVSAMTKGGEATVSGGAEAETAPERREASRAPDPETAARRGPAIAPDGAAAALPRVGVRARPPSKAQRLAWAYLRETGSCVTTYAHLSAALGIPVPTLRDILRKFAALGWVRKRKYVCGAVQGLEIRCVGLPETLCGAEAVPEDLRGSGAARPVPGALTGADVRLRWPCLRRMGMSKRVLDRVLGQLRKTGRSPEFLIRGLDHAEWECAQGRQNGKSGFWERLLRELCVTGYYPRPEGYVSPEERIALDSRKDADQTGRASRARAGTETVEERA